MPKTPQSTLTESSFNVLQAAAILVERRLSGTTGERLPISCRPTTLEQALTIQLAVTERWCEEQDDSIGAWKCGLPSPNKIVAAPIYTRSINSVAPVSLWSNANNHARIEPELAFFFGQDLPAREQAYTPEDVDAAISRTHMALELIGCRYSEPKTSEFPEMLADCLVNQGLFIGPQVDAELARNSQEISINIGENGTKTPYKGKHPSGNPRAPLYWLVEFLRSQGQGIVAGQAVITGSYAGVIEVPLNADITVEYQGLGKMEVNFKAHK